MHCVNTTTSSAKLEALGKPRGLRAALDAVLDHRALAITFLVCGLASCQPPFRGHHTFRITEDVSQEVCPTKWIAHIGHIEADVNGKEVTFRGRLGVFLKHHVDSSSLPVTDTSQFVWNARRTGAKRTVNGCTFEPEAEFSMVRAPSSSEWEGTFTVWMSVPWEDGCTLCDTTVAFRAPRT